MEGILYTVVPILPLCPPLLQSAGAAKAGKKAKNKKRDPTKPTNPKEKYRHREGEKREGWSRPDRPHKQQQAPLFVPVAETENTEPEDIGTSIELASTEESKTVMDVEDLEEGEDEQAGGDDKDQLETGDGAVASLKDTAEAIGDGAIIENLVEQIPLMEQPASASAPAEPAEQVSLQLIFHLRQVEFFPSLCPGPVG